MLASNVATGDRAAGADQRLRAEVNHRVHFPARHRALDRGVILERAVDLLDACGCRRCAPARTADSMSTTSADDRRAPLEQRLHDPRADDTGGAGDQDAPAAPAKASAHTVRLRYACGQCVTFRSSSLSLNGHGGCSSMNSGMRPQEIVHSRDRVVGRP